MNERGGAIVNYPTMDKKQKARQYAKKKENHTHIKNTNTFVMNERGGAVVIYPTMDKVARDSDKTRDENLRGSIQVKIALQ